MTAGNCDVCHNRPKYFDGTQTHAFCGKTCAAKATLTGKPPATVTCQIPGCAKVAYLDAHGKAGDYCSLKHKELATTACLMCRKAPKHGHHNYCGRTCGNAAEKKATMLLEVPQGHVTFKDVEEQFKSSWREPGTKPPQVKYIYKIVETPSARTNYEKYRAAVEARGHFTAIGKLAGNENRRWHGTHRECNLGDPNHTQFCGSATCRLCSIIQNSFDCKASGKNYPKGALRFGAGIYTSSTSATSNGYLRNGAPSPLKAILLNKVVVGRCEKSTGSNHLLTAPPTGYDSVVAEKSGWGGDELIVYSNDAIRPSYLVMYDA